MANVCRRGRHPVVPCSGGYHPPIVVANVCRRGRHFVVPSMGELCEPDIVVNMKKIILKIKNNLPTFIIGTLGVLARFIAMVMADPIVFQHDVAGEFGHLDYAVHIFRNWSLANHNFYEFSQPPVNAFLQAVVMKICSPFIRYSKINHTKLYSVTIILTFIFSCITLFIIYKILKEFDLSPFATNFVFGIMAFYPAILILSAEYNNDTISYMFFYLSLYLSIVWAKTKKLSTIILLALSIGIGMLTKVSVGIIAFITGPMMIAVLIKSNDKKKNTNSIICICTYCFPTWAILFNKEFDFV